MTDTNQPTQAYRRASYMKERYGDISDATLFRYIRSGKIPKPLKINGQNVWDDDQVAQADRNLIDSEVA